MNKKQNNQNVFFHELLFLFVQFEVHLWLYAYMYMYAEQVLHIPFTNTNAFYTKHSIMNGWCACSFIFLYVSVPAIDSSIQFFSAVSALFYTLRRHLDGYYWDTLSFMLLSIGAQWMWNVRKYNVLIWVLLWDSLHEYMCFHCQSIGYAKGEVSIEEVEILKTSSLEKLTCVTFLLA